MERKKGEGMELGHGMESVWRMQDGVWDGEGGC